MTSKRILVIDDGADIRLVARASLKKVGDWEVVTAGSGREGIAEAQAVHPDAILLDVMMPDMDGPTTYRELRANPATRDIPVILLTALSDADQRGLAELGVQGIITKPFDPMHLHEEVMDILARSNPVQQLEPAELEEDAFPQAELAEIWERFKDTNMERLAVLEQAAMTQLEGSLDEELRRHAEREAHKLAGAAGSFGFAEGSRLAREMERLLAGNAPLDQAQTLRCTELVVALRQELERPIIVEDRRQSGSGYEAAGGYPGDTQRVPGEQERHPERTREPAFRGAGYPAGGAGLGGLLIVGSDETTAERLVLEAAARGLRVEAVETAGEARSAIVRERPDVVLLDLSNPERSEEYLALLAQLSTITPAVPLDGAHAGKAPAVLPALPVLILTDRDTFVDRVQIAALGGRAFLQKPLLSSEVLNAVTDVLHQARAANSRVLAVDDDPQILDALQLILAPHGIELICLTDPLRFWDELEAHAPDLLILDVDMPQLSGLDLCRVVRSAPRWSTLPVLFLSGRTDPGTVHQVFAAGADDFVGKPIVEAEVVTRILNRLERWRLFRRLAEMDPVTGLINRRKSVQILDQFLRMADRHGQPVSLAVLHVDHFKDINDGHGHVAGDAVLHRIGELLSRTFRREDVVARWGGAEFVLGLYGMGKADAVQRLSGVLEALRYEPFAGPGGDRFQVSFSAGVAGYGSVAEGRYEDGFTVQALYRSADAALSQVKKVGGGRVVPAGWQLDQGRMVRTVDVVVVDDDESLAALLVHALQTRGYRTEWLADGEVAAGMLGGPEPTLQARVVLLDVDLPGMDGVGVLQQMAAWGITRRTRVIMLTYRSTEAEVLKALELGAFDHVAKPFSLPVLVQRICRSMED